MFCCAPGIELVNIWKLFPNPAVLICQNKLPRCNSQMFGPTLTTESCWTKLPVSHMEINTLLNLVEVETPKQLKPKFWDWTPRKSKKKKFSTQKQVLGVWFSYPRSCNNKKIHDIFSVFWDKAFDTIIEMFVNIQRSKIIRTTVL